MPSAPQELLTRLDVIPSHGDTMRESLISLDPSSGNPLAAVPVTSRNEYDARVREAQKRFLEWRTRPAPLRGIVVRELGELFRAHKAELGELISLEVGKIASEGLGEVQEMIDVCEFAVGLSRQLHGLTIASERAQHRMMEQWHPLGPVGVVTAFNFPMAVWAWNAMLAAVCGDTVIWKPSPHAPLCALAVQKLCDRVMKAHQCDGLFSTVVSGHELGEAMAEDVRLPLVSFTGSSAVGRRVAGTVATRLGRSLLELGGNNAVIVLDDADLELAARAIVFGAVGTAGQRCTSTRRLFVQRGVSKKLVDRLVAAYRSVKLGDPRVEGTLVGPLITREAVHRFEHALTEVKAQGGEVLVGGKVVEGRGNFVEPTIVRAPSHARFPIAHEETFAPILYVFEHDGLDDAIAMNNEVAQGLSSAIITRDLRASERRSDRPPSDEASAEVGRVALSTRAAAH